MSMETLGVPYPKRCTNYWHRAGAREMSGGCQSSSFSEDCQFCQVVPQREI